MLLRQCTALTPAKNFSLEVFMGIALRIRPKCILAQGKNGAGSEGENGNIMLLLDAAQELHRSSSGDDGNDIEPSTAGTAGWSQSLHSLLLAAKPACTLQASMSHHL